MSEIAHSIKGTFIFKTNARNQFHPYEILNYTENPTLIVPLRRTSEGMEKLLDQHGFNLKNTYYIDIITKHINSALENKNTKYLQQINLKDLHNEIEETLEKIGPGPKTLIIDDLHCIIPHKGELKTKRFIDRLCKRTEGKLTKTLILTNSRRLPKNVSKFLFNFSTEIIEIPRN